jgi:putative oxidoreductase
MTARVPWLLQFSDVALLFMRLLVGWIFIWSGASHLRDPVARGKSIGLALGLILVMLGAIQKKIAVWRTGFWGKHGTDGWHYELMLVAMLLVIATTGGGRFVVW